LLIKFSNSQNNNNRKELEMITKIKILLVSILVINLTSCGGNNESSSQNAVPKTVEFNLTANDQIQFNLKAMVVKAGDKIKINFENVGSMPAAQMAHNFILLKPDVDVAEFAAKAIQAKDKDYIPLDESQNIIVHSRLLGPGEKTVVEFNAPPQGMYKFICSFPGHYITMQGNFVVR
jgi:azurin